MKYLVIIIGLMFVNIAMAGDIYGHFRLDKYLNNNLPSYTDLTGPPLLYGLDLEVYKPLLNRYVDFMVGVVGKGSDHGFTQGGGKAGASLNIGQIKLMFYHLSLHNFDHESLSPQRFLNENRVSVQYDFGTH